VVTALGHISTASCRPSFLAHCSLQPLQTDRFEISNTLAQRTELHQKKDLLKFHLVSSSTKIDRSTKHLGKNSDKTYPLLVDGKN
jgi:hypothetical protein